jgi:hypothetical protein
MDRKISWKPAALLALWSLAPATSRAGPVTDWFCHRQADCPPPSYSPLHYWAPTLYRLHARHLGGLPESYTPTSFPDLPIQYRITPYPCPPVAPATAAASYP